MWARRSRLGIATWLLGALVATLTVAPAGAGEVRTIATAGEGGTLERLVPLSTSTVVALMRRAEDPVANLFAIPVEGGPTRPLTGMTDGEIDPDFRATPDGTRVVFLHDGPAGAHLYSVGADAAAPAVRLTPDYTEGTGVEWFQVSPDNVTVVFTAGYVAAEGDALYAAPVRGDAGARRLSPVMGTREVDADFVITPDAARVVFRSSESGSSAVLHSVPVVGGAAVALTDAAVQQPSSGYAVTANSAHVVYSSLPAATLAPEDHHVFAVPTAGGSAPRDLTPGHTVSMAKQFVVTADGQRVVFVDEADGIERGYSVGVIGGAPVLLARPLPDGAAADLAEYPVTGDGARLVHHYAYGDGRHELRSVPVAGPADADVVLYGSQAGIADGLGAHLHEVSSLGSHVLFQVAASSPEGRDLFTVPVAGPASAAIRMSPPLQPGDALLDDPGFSPDGLAVTFGIARGGQVAWYAAPTDGPAPAEPLVITGPVRPGVTPEHQSFTPDSRFFVYGADAEVAGRPDVFASDIVQQPPRAPVEVSLTPGDRELAVAWRRPPGGSAVTGYRVVAEAVAPASTSSSYSQAGAPIEVTVGGGETTALLSGLRNGATYDVVVYAANQAGEGAPSAAVTGIPTPTRGVSRLSGANRIITAVEVSRASFNPGVPVAFVATAGQFPDALSGGPAADRLGGPILLTAGGALSPETRTELERLQPQRIIVLGGTAAVSGAVLEELRPLAAGGNVERISGSDRFATAAAIAATFPAPASVVYIATGGNFPDALAGGAAAALTDSPILLTRGDRLPPQTEEQLRRLQPGRIVVLGGTAAVSNAVASRLQQFTSGTVTRLSGENRFATAGQVAATFPSASTVFVATGANFPDALAGTPAAGLSTAPIVLVNRDSIPAAIDAQLVRLRPTRIVILGGTSAVSARVQADLGGYLTD